MLYTAFYKNEDTGLVIEKKTADENYVGKEELNNYDALEFRTFEISDNKYIMLPDKIIENGLTYNLYAFMKK